MASDEAVVREELATDGRDYDAEAWRFLHNLNHGHNLWTTLLVERGIVGVLAVTAYLALGLFTFARLYRDLADDPDRQAAATLGLLVIIYLVVAGLGNTTMIVEHGQAAMLLVAIAWGASRQGQSNQG